MKFKYLLIFLSFLLFILLALALLLAPSSSGAALGEIGANIASSGVTNPVTAVLLNFRAFDTLLEVAVLMIALIAFFGFSTSPSEIKAVKKEDMSYMLAKILAPFIILGGVYMTLIGSVRPGGAFQAGAILASLLILLSVSGSREYLDTDSFVFRALASIGVVIFLLTGMAAMFFGAFLEYPFGLDKELILFVELFLSISLALILAAFFTRHKGTMR